MDLYPLFNPLSKLPLQMQSLNRGPAGQLLLWVLSQPPDGCQVTLLTNKTQTWKGEKRGRFKGQWLEDHGDQKVGSRAGLFHCLLLNINLNVRQVKFNWRRTCLYPRCFAVFRDIQEGISRSGLREYQWKVIISAVPGDRHWVSNYVTRMEQYNSIQQIPPAKAFLVHFAAMNTKYVSE